MSSFSLLKWLQGKWRRFRQHESDNSLREAIEELIGEHSEVGSTIDHDERLLLGNVLNLRNLQVQDIMIPRADIVAVSLSSTLLDLKRIFSETRHSKLPVYRENLDDIVGFIDIKDIINLEDNENVHFKSLIKEVFFIAPSMGTLDLLFKMRQGSATKLAMVVDEYGGIDGLVTFSDLIEEIIGDIQDAQDKEQDNQLVQRADGCIVADGRITLEELEDKLGIFLPLTVDEAEIETLGGLAVSVAGRVPVRGELLTHKKGFDIEILDADPRRVKRICLRGVHEAIARDSSIPGPHLI